MMMPGMSLMNATIVMLIAHNLCFFQRDFGCGKQCIAWVETSFISCVFLQMWWCSYSLGSSWGLFFLFGAAPVEQRGRECSRQVSADDDDDSDDAADNCNNWDAGCARFLLDNI
jgi:hypothetical protein